MDSTDQLGLIAHHQLSTFEMEYGCELIIDLDTDTGVDGNYTHIAEIIEGVCTLAKCFRNKLPIQESIPIVNVLYVCDRPDNGEVYLLEYNYVIYLGNGKIDVITCSN